MNTPLFTRHSPNPDEFVCYLVIAALIVYFVWN